MVCVKERCLRVLSLGAHLRECWGSLGAAGIGSSRGQSCPPEVISCPSMKVGTVEVEQAPAFGKQICYSSKKDLNLGLGGCGRKWLVQPGQAESEKTSHGDSKWRWNEVITEGQPGILGGTGGEVGK